MQEDGFPKNESENWDGIVRIGKFAACQNPPIQESTPDVLSGGAPVYATPRESSDRYKRVLSVPCQTRRAFLGNRMS